MKPTLIHWQCPRCDAFTEVCVYPIIPAKISGAPEDCYPTEGGDLDPGACQHCGAEIDPANAWEQAEQVDVAARESAAEDRWEEKRLEGGR